jgi:hypothetical protein
MEYRIIKLGNQYKVASLFGMRHAILFERYTVPVAGFENKLIQQLGYPLNTVTVRNTRRYQPGRWYSGWKNLSLSCGERLMAFADERDFTLALLQINQ